MLTSPQTKQSDPIIS